MSNTTVAQVAGGTRFEEAFVLANRLHATQVRKSTSIPYVGHLLGIASLVIEDGGSDDEVIAALLHDAVEDQGGAETLALIRQRFGDRVADIVDVYQKRLDSSLAAEVHATVEALLAASGSERLTELPVHSAEELEEWRQRRSARLSP